MLFGDSQTAKSPQGTGATFWWWWSWFSQKFQFTKETITEEPFGYAKIFGVENRDGVKYLDIAQLLVLFFQRGLLKVHGLWENYDERDLDDEDDNTNLFQVYIVDKTIDGFGRLVGRNKSKESAFSFNLLRGDDQLFSRLFASLRFSHFYRNLSKIKSCKKAQRKKLSSSQHGAK